MHDKTINKPRFIPPPKPEPENIRVYHPTLFQDIVLCAIDNNNENILKKSQKLEKSKILDYSQYGNFGNLSPKSPNSTSSPPVSPNTLRIQSKNELMKHRKDELNIRKQAYQEEKYLLYKREKELEQKKLKDKVIQKNKERDIKLANSINSLMDEKPFVNSIDQLLSRHEAELDRKKHAQYTEWSNKVYDTIQYQIQNKLSKVTTDEIERRKNEQFDAFLAATNAKEGLYRDIIIESDYDPFVHKKDKLTYSTSNIRDPLKKPLIKEKEEIDFRKTLFVDEPHRVSAGPQKNGRETLDLKYWGVVESTPYGHYSHEMPRKDETAKSSVVFDHYNIDTSAATLNREFNTFRGK